MLAATIATSLQGVYENLQGVYESLQESISPFKTLVLTNEITVTVLILL